MVAACCAEPAVGIGGGGDGGRRRVGERCGGRRPASAGRAYGTDRLRAADRRSARGAAAPGEARRATGWRRRWDDRYPDAASIICSTSSAPGAPATCWWWPAKATTSGGGTRCRSTGRATAAWRDRTCRRRSGPASRCRRSRSGRWTCSRRCWTGSACRCRRGSMARRSGGRGGAGR